VLDNYQAVGVFIFGVVFLASGIIAVSKRRITFAFRSGTLQPSAVGIFAGTPALIYGVGSLIGGSAMVFPIFVFMLGRDDGKNLIITSIAGITMFVIGFLLASIIQIAISWGERAGKQKQMCGCHRRKFVTSGANSSMIIVPTMMYCP
jgi:hypothetical protein